MKDSNNNCDANSNNSHEVIRPKSIKKLNINFFETCENYFPESLNFPDNLSEKEIEILKEKNKKFFNEYLEKWEENSLLRYKLQDLLNKKNEIHKYLIQLDDNIVSIRIKAELNNKRIFGILICINNKNIRRIY